MCIVLIPAEVGPNYVIMLMEVTAVGPESKDRIVKMDTADKLRYDC